MAVLLLEFVVGVVLMSAGSYYLPRAVDAATERLGLPEGLAGVVAALAGDTPEITTATAALAAGASNVGVGVALGSNVYNIAVLLGLSAAVAGGVAIPKLATVVHGMVALSVSVLVALLVEQVLAPVPVLAITAVIML